MANIIMIVGDTGTGKSTSFKNLSPNETVIINVTGKELPWKGSKKQYNAANKNIAKLITSEDIIKAMSAKSTDPDIKNIIIDDIGFSMLNEFFEKANTSGYDKFTKMAVNMQSIIKFAQNQVPADKNVIMTFHEDVADKQPLLKTKLIGRMLDDKYNPLAVVSICLFTSVSFNEEKKAEYSFITNRMINDASLEVPAKSPEGMFPSLKIPNDMQKVLDCMKKYYEGE